MWRAAVVAVCVPVLLPATAAARDPLSRANWADMTHREAGVVRAQVRHAPPAARRLVARVARHVTFRRGDPAGFAHGDAAYTLIDGDGVRFVVSYSPGTLRGGPVGRHLILHELGHVVENALMDGRQRDRVLTVLGGSPLWRDCFEADPAAWEPCVPEAEIFADQFAFWASRNRAVRSSYDVPPLVSRAAFGRAMSQVRQTRNSLIS